MDSTSLLDAFARQKGVACIDDLTSVEPERLSLLAHHELLVSVEYCVAARPSSSLRGSREKYVNMFDAIEPALSSLRGEGMLTVRRATGAEVKAAIDTSNRGWPQHLRPGSANARLRQSSEPSDDDCPRIGSFEVSFHLVNQRSGERYGPAQIHSKLQSRRWPLFDKLRQRLDEQLQKFLALDTGRFNFHQEFEKAQALTARQQQQEEQNPETPSNEVQRADVVHRAEQNQSEQEQKDENEERSQHEQKAAVEDEPQQSQQQPPPPDQQEAGISSHHAETGEQHAQPREEQPNAEQPQEEPFEQPHKHQHKEQPAHQQPHEEQPALQQPQGEQPALALSHEEQPEQEQPALELPAPEQPAKEQSAQEHEQPEHEVSGQEQPTPQESGEVQPYQEQQEPGQRMEQQQIDRGKPPEAQEQLGAEVQNEPTQADGSTHLRQEQQQEVHLHSEPGQKNDPSPDVVQCEPAGEQPEQPQVEVQEEATPPPRHEQGTDEREKEEPGGNSCIESAPAQLVPSPAPEGGGSDDTASTPP